MFMAFLISIVPIGVGSTIMSKDDELTQYGGNTQGYLIKISLIIPHEEMNYPSPQVLSFFLS
jgi:hypothetical protein